MFILTGSFEDEYLFNDSKNWFNKYVYDAKRNLRLRTKKQITGLQEHVEKLYNIKRDLEQEIKELQELRKEFPKSIREKYRRRTNKNVNR